jgi:hypothetical protein
LARLCGVTAIVFFWLGLLAMFLLGFFGLIQLAGTVWFLLTSAPLAVLVVQHLRRRHDPAYQRGRQCQRCGHRWMAPVALRIVARNDTIAVPEIDGLRRLEHRQAASAVRLAYAAPVQIPGDPPTIS